MMALNYILVGCPWFFGLSLLRNQTETLATQAFGGEDYALPLGM